MKVITRKEQAKQTREKILDVCKTLMKKYTFEEISISMICQEANISIGAFYHHFKNKSSVIVEMYRDIDILFIEKVLPECLELEPKEAIIQYLCEQNRYAEDSGIDLTKSVYKAQVENGNDFISSDQRGLVNGLRSLIERAIEENVLAEDTEVETLLEELLVMSRGAAYYWCIKNGSFDLQVFVRTLCSKFLIAYER